VYTIDIEDGENLRGLLDRLILREKEVKEVWEDSDRIDREAMVMINEVDIGLTGGLSTAVNENDEIVILPLVHGG
jgi:molybdopterin converting factor small subunit